MTLSPESIYAKRSSCFPKGWRLLFFPEQAADLRRKQIDKDLRSWY